jgi:hypothetical protein
MLAPLKSDAASIVALISGKQVGYSATHIGVVRPVVASRRIHGILIFDVAGH